MANLNVTGPICQNSGHRVWSENYKPQVSFGNVSSADKCHVQVVSWSDDFNQAIRKGQSGYQYSEETTLELTYDLSQSRYFGSNLVNNQAIADVNVTCETINGNNHPLDNRLIWVLQKWEQGTSKSELKMYFKRNWKETSDFKFRFHFNITILTFNYTMPTYTDNPKLQVSGTISHQNVLGIWKDYCDTTNTAISASSRCYAVEENLTTYKDTYFYSTGSSGLNLSTSEIISGVQVMGASNPTNDTWNNRDIAQLLSWKFYTDAQGVISSVGVEVSRAYECEHPVDVYIVFTIIKIKFN